jgi:hypothetical protein
LLYIYTIDWAWESNDKMLPVVRILSPISMLVSVVVHRVIRDVSDCAWPKYVVGCYQFVSYSWVLLLCFACFNWFGFLSGWMSHCSFEFGVIFYYFMLFFLIVWLSSTLCNELLCCSDLDSLHSKFLHSYIFTCI